MLIPGRHARSDDYRYAFNGMEADDEIKGEGNSYDFGARMYDNRISRFFKMDPKFMEFPYWSPYSFAGNNPIRFFDKNGESPGDPMHHEFLTTVAIEVYNFIKSKGGSTRGALLVISQASFESLWGKEAIRYKDYNLFGIMTLGEDYKRTTSHGRVRDYSKKGGFAASVSDFYNNVSRKWEGYAVLLTKNSFTPDDIDKALYTGDYIEWEKERNKTGHFSYNWDDVDEPTKTNNNEYGTRLFNQMKSVKKRFLNSLNYQIEKNNKRINEINDVISELNCHTECDNSPYRKDLIDERSYLNNQNKDLNTIKDEVSKEEL